MSDSNPTETQTTTIFLPPDQPNGTKAGEEANRILRKLVSEGWSVIYMDPARTFVTVQKYAFSSPEINPVTGKPYLLG